MKFSVEFLVKSYQNKRIVSTKRVLIKGAESLQGVMREGTGAGGVVICHPHPLYGGDMENGVVEAIEEGFHESGLTTLRFNFRGVGSSTGHYGDGDGEKEDVIAACRFLREEAVASGRFVLAGYSFGAWVSARALGELPFLTDLFLVAFPFSMGGADSLRAFSGRISLVGGSRDDISPLDDLLALHKALEGDKYLKVIPASHFFEGKVADITAFILETCRQGEG
jgi:uncharacterized protein